jgi:hypothetical protein
VSGKLTRAGNREPSLHHEPEAQHRFYKGRPRLRTAPYTCGRPFLSTGGSMGEVWDFSGREIIANVKTC